MPRISSHNLDRLLGSDDLADYLVRDYSTTGILDTQLQASIAAGLAEASGNKDLDSVFLRHPYLSTLIPGVVGGTLGGFATYHVLDNYYPDMLPYTKKFISYGGMALGGMLGQAAAALARRAKVKKIKEYVKNRKLNPDLISTDSVEDVLSSAVYNRGKLLTKEMIEDQ